MIREATQTVTRNTLVPIGLVAGVIVLLLTATWAIATDRQQAKEQIRHNTTTIQRHETEIRELRGKLDYLTQGMVRVESKLGTLPEGTPK